MSNVIPPLVCDTPPPMDFETSPVPGLGDDDFGGFESADNPYTLDDVSENIKSDFDPVVPELELPKSPIHIPNQQSQISESPDPTTLPECDQAIRFADAEKFNNSISMENSIANDEFNKIKHRNFPDEEGITVITDILHENVNDDHLFTSLSPEIVETNIDECIRSDSPPPIVEPSDYYNENKFFETDDDYIDTEQPNNDHSFTCLPSLKLDSLNSSGSTSPDVRSLKNEEIIEQKPIDLSNEDHSENLKKPSSIESPDENVDDSGYDQPTSQKDAKTDSNIQEEDYSPIDNDKNNDFNNFDADFSQFESFSTNFPVKTESNINANIVENVKISEISQFDEDDFDDFTEFTSNSMVEEPNKQPAITDNIVDDDDDDFGDFSDFTQSQLTNLTTQLEQGSTQIVSVLSMMFPNVDLNENDNDKCPETFENGTTDQVKNFENSKALEHQWQTSTGKNTLVTALGIDIRNILYGGQWNSSMPRFAANLGFSPLEPIRASQNAGYSSASTSNVDSSSASSLTDRPSDIPAVQFDWTSSGLVNPLDASHAHTLLLDLEQLVVVANLDKIKLDSPTCSASASTTLLMKNTSSSHKIIDHHHLVDHNNIIEYCGDAAVVRINGVGGNGNCNIPTSSFSIDLLGSIVSNDHSLDNTSSQFGLFDEYLENRIQEILHKTSIPQDQPARPELNWTSTTTESPILLTSVNGTDQIPATTVPSPASTVISTIEPTIMEQESIPTPVSSSYVIPGSGSLKETHIYTPDIVSNSSSLVKEPADSKCPDFDYDKAAAGIIINENVVKKEYRDIEYNPEIIQSTVASQLPSTDDFSEFQYASSTTSPFSNFNTNMDILQPTGTTGWLNSSKKSNEIDLLSVLPSLKDSKPNIIDEIDLKLDNLCRNDKQHSELANDNYAKPRIGISPTDNMFGTTLVDSSQSSSSGKKNDDEFTEFQSVSTGSLNLASLSARPICPISHPLAPMSVISQKSLSSSAVLTPQITSLICESSSNINWPDPGINPDELARLEAIFTVPNTKPNNSNQSTAPIQSISSTKKVPAARSEDDEWTDFVSSTPKPQPITQIINDNINKLQQQSGDDDDWTEFVSSTPPVIPQMQPLSSSNQWTSGPNFTSWNAPPQFNSWQSSTIYKPPQPLTQTIPFTNQSSLSSSPKFNNFKQANSNTNNNNTSYRPSQMNNNNTNFPKSSKAPSISLIPDLSFIAPKNLMNRGSRTNYPTTTKK